MADSVSDARDRLARGVSQSALRVVLACAAVAGVVGVSGAGPVRAALWVFNAVVGAGLGLGVSRWIVPPSWFQGLAWRPALFIPAVLWLPMTAIALAGAVLVQHARFGLPLVWEVAPQVLGVALIMTILSFLVRRQSTHTHAAAAGAPPPKFLQRLPAKLKGAEIYAVEAEDHYLRLHTSKGQDLILMRLSDAIAELEGIAGAQTHRSWWVARDAVTEVEPAEGRALLTLKGGTVVPVSRGFARPLKAAGWF